jgi:hypothetical protein
LPELADDGTVLKLVGTIQDETERVETEQVRRAAETRFEGVFEQAGVGARHPRAGRRSDPGEPGVLPPAGAAG